SAAGGQFGGARHRRPGVSTFFGRQRGAGLDRGGQELCGSSKGHSQWRHAGDAHRLASAGCEALTSAIMANIKKPRWGWALTGSGHFFKECLGIVRELEDVDLFVSRAAAEVIRMYRQGFTFSKSMPIYSHPTLNAPPL